MRSILPSGPRAGIALRSTLFLLALLGISAASAPLLLPKLSLSADEKGPLMHRVSRGLFIHEITSGGTVESASNVEIRCEVESKNQGGIQILRIVPEGTYVQPGDFLVEFDSSALDNERIQQEISVNTSRAEVIRAKNALSSAELALKEYVEGTYIQSEKTLQGKEFVAKENERRAREFLKYNQELARKGYIPESQLVADEFAVEKAVKDLEAATTELLVLRKYTREKMVGQLESDIETSKATLDSREKSLAIEETELEDINTQIKNCTVIAPSAGQVVYNNESDWRGNRETIIEPGAQIRQRQTIIKLPDSSKMQVLAKVKEGQVALVRSGLSARIRLEAISDTELQGVVDKVNEYPAPTSFFSSSIKEYETAVRILTPVKGLRPGLTAEVRLLVRRLQDVVRVPIQTVFEHGAGKFYCVMRDGDRFVAHAVKLGPTNEEFVVVEAGLQEDDQIVAHAAAYRDKVGLPALPPVADPGPGTAEGASPTAASSPGAPGAVAGGAGIAPGGPPPQPPAGGGSGGPGGFVQRLDTNGDGQVDANELSAVPTQFRDRLTAADSNRDGTISREELAAGMARMGGDRRPRGPEGGAPAGGGAGQGSGASRGAP